MGIGRPVAGVGAAGPSTHLGLNPGSRRIQSSWLEAFDGDGPRSKVDLLDSITQIEHSDDADLVWPVHAMRGTKGQPW
jgi:hypothetical protein